MTGHINKLSFACLCLLALWLIGVTGAAGQVPGQKKTGLCFKNCTDRTLLVQGISVVNGMSRLGPQIIVYPNKTGWDTNLPQGTRHIIVSDPNQPNTKLADARVPFYGRDLYFHIRERGGKVCIDPE